MNLRLSHRINWVTICLSGLALFACSISLLSTDYDWDLDHEIYFGQRLYFRELIWTDEFHDKLPFVQLLMYFPGATGSTLTWKAISLTTVIAAALTLRSLLPRMIAQSETAPWIKSVDASHLALVYVFVANYQLGGITQINAIATSLYVVAVLSLFTLRLTPLKWTPPLVMLVTSAFCTAAAVSIRPYLAAPFLIAGIWFLFANGAFATKVPRQHILLRFGGWVALTLFFFIAGNFGPYLITGQTAKFWVGMQALSSKLNPHSAAETFFPFGGIALMFIGLVFLSLALSAFYQAPRVVTYWLLFIALSSGALLAFISTRHWWPHYLDMFTGLVVFFLGVVVAWIATSSSNTRMGRKRILSLVLIVLMCCVVAVSQKTLIAQQPNDSKGKAALEFVNTLRESHQGTFSFLAPEDMRIHWQARESRHGFPHAANTYQLLSGWWAGLQATPVPNLPNSITEYCKMMQDSELDFILLSEGSKLSSCFGDKDGSYQPRMTISDSGSIIVVYSEDKIWYDLTRGTK
jgi:hypothetical protein